MPPLLGFILDHTRWSMYDASSTACLHPCHQHRRLVSLLPHEVTPPTVATQATTRSVPLTMYQSAAPDVCERGCQMETTREQKPQAIALDVHSSPSWDPLQQEANAAHFKCAALASCYRHIVVISL